MRDPCCESTIDTSGLEVRQRRVLAIVFAINTVTFLLVTASAFLSGSSSLLSGALDNLGDALTYALSFAVVGGSAGAKARVALVKGLLILLATIAVAGQIAWRLQNPAVPIIETMGLAALLNLAANAACLGLLHPYRDADINMASVWECSRNDVFEGVAVIAATLAVWIFESGWPDLLIASTLLWLFLRSTIRVLGSAIRQIREGTA
ncbi:MAG: cation transporter [Myxococcales bacterium]|nr:cation transporter [Myxococcales bacterium]